ncbi:MAG: lipocalin family protein [Bacteroidetes bacterium]|nr:lipocalin family protein [Bacteroidota bacterium]
MKKLRSAYCLVIVFAIIITGCRKSNDNNSASIIGTWKINSIETKESVSGASIAGLPSDSTVVLNGNSTITFNSNGSYTVLSSASDSVAHDFTSSHGSYKLEGVKLISFDSTYNERDTATISVLTSINLTIDHIFTEPYLFNGTNAVVKTEVINRCTR